MVDPGMIQGKRLNELFQQLIDSQTIISMRLEGADFERLTCIIALEADEKGSFIVVDAPDGFRKVAGAAHAWKLRFNFNGPDRLEYLFATQGGAYSPSGLRIPFPTHVVRLQRRRDFRILTPVGTRMVIDNDRLRGIIDLINISMGGAYGVLIKHNVKDPAESVLAVNQHIGKIGIIFPPDNTTQEQIVIIRDSEVRRIEHDLERDLFKFAFEFKEIEPAQRKKLTQYIYYLQRQFLQRR